MIHRIHFTQFTSPIVPPLYYVRGIGPKNTPPVRACHLGIPLGVDGPAALLDERVIDVFAVGQDEFRLRGKETSRGESSGSVQVDARVYEYGGLEEGKIVFLILTARDRICTEQREGVAGRWLISQCF